MTTDNPDHFQQKIADAKSDVRSTLDQLSDNTLRRVAICVACGMVADCVVLAATNVGSEQHSWWGWLLIGVPLSWLSFLGLIALTSGALRAIVGALRWSLSSRRGAEVSLAASRQTGPQVRHFDMSVNRLVSVA